ncbi:MAG: hypothetical protein JST17_10905 [Bacteroidetes bacterium]|nr:hypothetical protein [Bacteroidota bacterium]MBS1930404.1 hypothetical protein [Bacteroidota bacterium]
MFRNLKMYLILAVISAAAVLLILNKFLVYGLVVAGVGFAAVLLYQAFMKQKDDEIANLRSQLKESDKAGASLKSENTELRNRKLNISEIKSVVDLGLMEVNTNFTRVWNDKSENDGKQIRFLGALQVSIVAKYGLDMQDLRVKFDPDKNELTVANIQPKFLSFSNLNYDWKIAEVLLYSVPLVGEKHWQTTKDLEALNSEMKENYRKRINEEVKNGPAEMEWVLTPLKKQVGSALELMLGANGRKIKIVEKFDDSFKALSEFTNKENS